MVDRSARERMITALRGYMDERLTAFEFHNELFEIETDDETSITLRGILWGFYDDLKDHKVTASKADWDCLNRILLLLESDGELRYVPVKRIFSMQQFVAIGCLVLFGAIAFRMGLSGHIFQLSVPFGLISMLLYHLEERKEKKRKGAEYVIAPFPTVASLMGVRRSVPSFVKRRYPRSIEGRQVRSRISEICIFLPGWIAWLLLAPIPLFVQAMPEVEETVQVVLPA